MVISPSAMNRSPEPLAFLFSCVAPRPARRSKSFITSFVVQGTALVLLVQLGLVKPQLLIPKKYQYISLVTTPPPLNHKPQPVRPKLLPPPPVVPPERIVAEAKIPPAPVLERSKPEVREAPRELT